MSVQDVIDRAHGIIDDLEGPIDDLEASDIRSDQFQDIFREFKIVDKYINNVQSNIHEFAENSDDAFEEYEGLVQRFDDLNSKVENVVEQFQKQAAAQGGIPGAGSGGGQTPSGAGQNDIIDMQDR